MSHKPNMQDPRVVISVGQCGFDNSQIRSVIAKINPEIGVIFTDTANETLDALENLGERVALVLVNRVFDVDGESGVHLVREIKREGSGSSEVAVMLVSNYKDAQAMAIADGALPGFGKSELNLPETRQKLEAVIG